MFSYKKFIDYMIPALIIVGSLVGWSIKLPVVNENFYFYVSEFIVIGAFFLLVYKKIKNKEDFKENKFIIAIMISYVVYCLVVVLFHCVTSGINMKYIAYPRITIEGLMLIMIINNNIIKKECFYKVFLSFFTLLVVFQVIVFFIIGDIRLSTVATNINIFTCLSLMFLPIIFKRICMSKKKYERILLLLLIAIDILVLLFSGSRTSSVLLVVFSLIACIIFIIKKEHKKVAMLGITLVTAVILVFPMLTLASYYGQESLLRSVGLSREMFASMFAKPTNDEGDEVVRVEIPDNSDKVRSQIVKNGIKKAKESPLIGNGIVTYKFKMGGEVVEQSPHNFLLEGILGVGIIGSAMIYFIVFYLMIYEKFKKKENVLIKITILAALLMYSFTQPTMLSTLIIFTYFILSSISTEENDTKLKLM